MSRGLRAVLVVVLIAVAIVVLFNWVFPWVERQTQDPTVASAVALLGHDELGRAHMLRSAR